MEIFERILGIILPVFFSIGIGFGYGRLRGPAVKSDMIAVNRVSMDVLCPLLVFTALPSAVFCFMMAEKYRQEPDQVASIVLLGNLAALAFVPLGLWLGLH